MKITNGSVQYNEKENDKIDILVEFLITRYFVKEDNEDTKTYLYNKINELVIGYSFEEYKAIRNYSCDAYDNIVKVKDAIVSSEQAIDIYLKNNKLNVYQKADYIMKMIAKKM